jgi:hypothetical protein
MHPTGYDHIAIVTQPKDFLGLQDHRCNLVLSWLDLKIFCGAVRGLGSALCTT